MDACCLSKFQQQVPTPLLSKVAWTAHKERLLFSGMGGAPACSLLGAGTHTQTLQTVVPDEGGRNQKRPLQLHLPASGLACCCTENPGGQTSNRLSSPQWMRVSLPFIDLAKYHSSVWDFSFKHTSLVFLRHHLIALERAQPHHLLTSTLNWLMGLLYFKTNQPRKSRIFPSDPQLPCLQISVAQVYEDYKEVNIIWQLEEEEPYTADYTYTADYLLLLLSF